MLTRSARATQFLLRSDGGKVLAQTPRISILKRGLSDGVTVAQLPLEEFVMVRIHVGQPIPSPQRQRSSIAEIPTIRRSIAIAVMPGEVAELRSFEPDSAAVNDGTVGFRGFVDDHLIIPDQAGETIDAKPKAAANISRVFQGVAASHS